MPSTVKMTLFTIVSFSMMIHLTVQPSCKLQNWNSKGYTRDGDIIIGGIFPVQYGTASSITTFTTLPEKIRCEHLHFRKYRWVQGFIFAIEEINQNKILLPNITLGFAIYDSCGVTQKAIEGTMWLVTGQEEAIPNYRCQSRSSLAAVIGAAPSQFSIPMAQLLGLYHYPQISYSASVVDLSDKNQFPSFFRTIPSDGFQSLALARLVLHFGWTWIGLLASDGDYGINGIKIVKEELIKGGACIAFIEYFTSLSSKELLFHIVEVVKKSQANVVVIFATEVSFFPLMEEIGKENITGKVWISSEAWTLSSLFSKKEFMRTLSGSIGIMTRKGVMPGFQEYLFSLHPSKSPNDIFIKKFWETAFSCKWPNSTHDEMVYNGLSMDTKLCTGEEELKKLNNSLVDVSSLRMTYNVYNAVYAVAYALHDLYSCKLGEGPFADGTCADIPNFEPWQLLYYVKNVCFKSNDGSTMFFNKNGDPPPVYEILNWQKTPQNTLQYVKLGMFDYSAPEGQELIINDDIIMWNGGQTKIPQSVCSESCPLGYRKAAHLGQPVCCFDCIQCSEGQIANQTDSTECLMCPDDHWSNERRDECILKATEFLSYRDPMGATLAAISIFCALFPATILCIFIKYRDTPIVKANNRELSFLLLLALVLCFLCSLLFIGLPKTITCMFRQVAFGIIFALCVSCVLAKTIMVVIAFHATIPSSKLKRWVGPKLPNTIVFICTVIQVIICTIWLYNSPPFPVQNMKSQIGMIIIECNDGSTIAFWLVLGYMGLLATISFVVAFLARNLPDSFNEAKFITFSKLVFVSVWLVFIPAYLSTKGKYVVAVEIFAILASSIGLLGCIFFPKCYIILLKPDMNTREYLMGKGTFSSKG
ncbi:extracellular calcium-sensing receptor-like [Latimeria chalumnae]|uniref:extracellular calcium-sensing receptor-like n=1 Tax=Latimeria chalumnae TaxID=7897 RepID=UPI0003C1A99B|nr:PREDICTED: extracellular calcium-sensing receptor-like [Latimeria chalumnae]|eukprot:XP_006006278.1 PREDICTED: extracellular calcium-sensing receptor-like [Latimeria chalumnae]